MRRWRVAVGVVVLGVMAVAGCARPGTAEPADVPPGSVLVAEWKRYGGFVPVGYNLVVAPQLAIYSDGRAVAQALTELTLTPDEVRSILTETRSALDGLDPVVTSDRSVQVADAPTTEITVLTAAGGRQSVKAEALGIVDGFPTTLAAADTRLQKLLDRVTTDGTPFISDRVRLVAQIWSGPDVPAQSWPSDVPVPPATPSGPRRVADLSGADAAAVVRLLPGAHWPDGGNGPALTAPDGQVYGVVWRYLLRHE